MRRLGWGCPCCRNGGAGGALNRREAVRAGLGGLGLAVLGGGAALAQVSVGGGGAPRRLSIQRVQTGETFDGVYWSDGRYDRDALRRLDWVFRDPSMEEATPMDPRLFDVLHTVARLMDAAEAFQVVSGYRAPETNEARARASRRVWRVCLHWAGLAAVGRLPGRVSSGLARLAAEMQVGGVGLYRRDGFVHLDCGPARRW